MAKHEALICCIVLLVDCLAATATIEQDGSRVASIVLNPETNRLHVEEGMKRHDVVAFGRFKDQINETGWAFLEIETNKSYTDEIQAYAAGVLEANLTRDLIEKQWINMYAHYCDNQWEFCARLKTFLEHNLLYTGQQALKLGSTDPYWHQVHMQMKQLRGLSDEFENEELNFSNEYTNGTRVLFFNIEGDLLDLEQALGRKESAYDVRATTPCTALIKVLNDSRDIYFSHDAWFLYRSMLRIQKKYSIALHTTKHSSDVVPGHVVAMSSYPGKLVSLDDFYLTSTGLAVTETTIDNDNPALWEFLNPNASVLTWVRGAVANRLASTGHEWVSIFKRENSGTYNNQWSILDYKLFTPNQPIRDNTLWVLEQMPSVIEAADLSHVLRKQGYWPSYNVAYFKHIFNISGQPALVAKYGAYYSYAGAPRARIIRRDHGTVHDMDSMMRLMRYNDYKHDPVSACNCTPPYNPVYAMSSRYDLLDPEGTYDVPRMNRRAVGGIDMKLTNSSLFKSSEFIAISGPTHESVPAFQWSTSGFQEEHVGHPDLWTFGPVLHHWWTRA
ncbi:putative phospholipase B-like 2 isoform X2 [Ornithodoros turicata]